MALSAVAVKQHSALRVAVYVYYNAGMTTAEPLLLELGARVRALREGAGVSRQALAERSGLSLRFLAGVEAGRSNISILNLAALARALGSTPARLLGGDGGVREAGRGTDELALPPVRIALLGARGAGKSTVGKKLARKLRVRFVELDTWIEEAAGLTLSEIFSVHGEGYYRRLEREALEKVLAGEDGLVIAAGGSLVTAPGTYSRLREAATTVWLRADAKDHWHRVLEQGDRRPMAQNPNAMGELRALLSARAPLYSEAAHIVDTRKLAVDEVVDAIATALRG